MKERSIAQQKVKTRVSGFILLVMVCCYCTSSVALQLALLAHTAPRRTQEATTKSSLAPDMTLSSDDTSSRATTKPMQVEQRQRPNNLNGQHSLAVRLEIVLKTCAASFF